MSALQQAPIGAAYLAPAGFEAQLAAELGGNAEVRGALDLPATGIRAHGRLLLTAAPPRPVVWAQNVWLEPQLLPIRSITDAAAQLRGMQRSWTAYTAGELHRRTQLIQELLPHVSAKPLAFPATAPSAPLGSYTLLDKDTLLASARCSSPFPHGEAVFVEDHVRPPSRAYLKLWEALTLLGARPGPGARCLELGASPGGWTWVLAGLGAAVVAVDRAALDERLLSDPLITYKQGDAFAQRPDRTDASYDWLLSDVICYPDKLLELVREWLDSGRCRNFVVTLKFQGDAHYDAIAGFRALPGGRLVHLAHNKHELTWMRFAP